MLTDDDAVRQLRKLRQRQSRSAAINQLLYLTGSFSPTLVGAGTAGTFTYGAGNLVEWTRIGNRLLFNGRVDISATTVAPVGAMTINGWPYAGVADTNMAIAGEGAGSWRGVNMPANYWYITLQFANGSSVATLTRSGTNNNAAGVGGGDLAGGVYDFRFGGNYRIQ